MRNAKIWPRQDRRRRSILRLHRKSASANCDQKGAGSLPEALRPTKRFRSDERSDPIASLRSPETRRFMTADNSGRFPGERPCNQISAGVPSLLFRRSRESDAKAGTWGFQALAPCSCQEQALGACFRGGDEFGCAWNWIAALKAGVHLSAARAAGGWVPAFAGTAVRPRSSRAGRPRPVRNSR